MRSTKENVWDEIEAFDEKLSQHCKRTAEYSEIIAEILDQPKEMLYTAGLVHDIGKIYIPKMILNKKEYLTAKERSLVDCHSFLGYQYLYEHDFPLEICECVLLHHGKSKITINIHFEQKNLYLADIVRACDIYDAVTHDRCYHKKCTHMDAIQILKEQKEPIPDEIIIILQRMEKCK